MSKYSDGPLGWIGVDFDRTLTTRQHDGGPEIGEPIQPMLDRVKKWLTEGRRVKIFTARVSGYYDDGIDGNRYKALDQHDKIKAWCEEHFGRTLEVTCIKDSYCKELWDDIAVAVEENTGRQLSPSRLEGPPPPPDMPNCESRLGELLSTTEVQLSPGFIN